MNRNLLLAQALGQGLGNAAQSFLAERDRLRLQGQADQDRARTLALQNRQVLQQMAPGMMLAGQYEGLANALNASNTDMRSAGFNVPNNAIVGAEKVIHRPSAAPAAGPFSTVDQGNKPGTALDHPLGTGAAALYSKSLTPSPDAPMSYSDVMTKGLNAGPAIGNLAPLAPESVTARDFNNPATVNALYAGLGLQAPKPKTEIRTLGNGGYLVLTTNPDGTVTTQEHKPDPKAGALKQDPVTGQWFTPTAGQTTHVKPTKAGSTRAGRQPGTMETLVGHDANGNEIWKVIPKVAGATRIKPKKGKDKPKDPFLSEDPAPAKPAQGGGVDKDALFGGVGGK